MSDIVEAVSRAICVADGVDPDKTSIGFGHQFPKGVEYKLWEARRKQAEAALAAVGVETEQLRAEIERLRALNAKLQQVREAAEAWRADTALPVDHLRTAWIDYNLRAALDEVKV
jgi:hypothetical protein